MLNDKKILDLSIKLLNIKTILALSIDKKNKSQADILNIIDRNIKSIIKQVNRL